MKEVVAKVPPAGPLGFLNANGAELLFPDDPKNDKQRQTENKVGSGLFKPGGPKCGYSGWEIHNNQSAL